jgi:RNA helicase.
MEFGRNSDKEKLQGARTDLREVQRELDEGASDATIAREHFSLWCQYGRRFTAYRDLVLSKPRDFKTEVRVFWGDSDTGKTRRAYEIGNELFGRDPDNVKWYNGFCVGYDGGDCVLLDDFNPITVPLTDFLALTDRYPLKINIKGGDKNWNPKMIIITSNIDPTNWYAYEDNRHFHAIMRRLDVIEHFKNEKNEKNAKMLRSGLGNTIQTTELDSDDILESLKKLTIDF